MNPTITPTGSYALDTKSNNFENSEALEAEKCTLQVDQYLDFTFAHMR